MELTLRLLLAWIGLNGRDIITLLSIITVIFCGEFCFAMPHQTVPYNKIKMEYNLFLVVKFSPLCSTIMFPTIKYSYGTNFATTYKGARWYCVP
jgi:hypothetical protein